MIKIQKKGFSSKDGIVASFHNKRYCVERHIHQYSELVYVIDGEFAVITDQKRETAKKGDIVIFPPYQPHGYCTDMGSTVHLWMILFSNSLITDITKSTNSYFRYEKPVFTPSDPLKAFIESRMIDTGEETVILDEAGIRRIKGLLYPVFDEYMAEVSFYTEPKKGDGAAINIILQYISQHYLENITLSDVCNTIGYSKSHISHLLTERLDLNFRAVLNSFRITHARSLLISTNMKSFNIAIESGFENERTFHRCFKEMMGITPNEYKKNYIKNHQDLKNEKNQKPLA